jgi:hypothetical protein
MPHTKSKDWRDDPISVLRWIQHELKVPKNNNPIYQTDPINQITNVRLAVEQVLFVHDNPKSKERKY